MTENRQRVTLTQ